MNKSGLVSAIAEKSSVMKKDAEKFLNAFEEVVEETLIAGEKVYLVGFGTFGVSARNARQGKNPSTGAIMRIDASKVPVFKPGKSLKDAVKK